MLGVRCTGSTSHNIGLDDPWVHRSKTTQNSVKRHFGLKILGASPSGLSAPHSPESATLTVIIIPVTPDSS